MSLCTLVLTLLVLQVGLVCCFTWDVVVSDMSENITLIFFYRGTVTHIEDVPSAKEIHSITYDPVHYRVIFASNQEIYSFDLSTRNIQTLLKRTFGYYSSVAYDPVTDLLFWKEAFSIHSFSLNPASSNQAVDGNLIVEMNHFCYDIAVDSCGGYIYWSTDYAIERVRFDGSEREVLIDSNVLWRYSLAIDQQTQTIYWTEKVHGLLSIESADFNGKYRRSVYTVQYETQAGSLTVSNDFIYWQGYSPKAIWQLPKNRPQQLEAKIISNTNRFNSYFQVIAANYTIKEQIQGNMNCKSLKSLIPTESEPVHGTTVSGESHCETQGYTGKRCDAYVCQNYCLQGNCSVSAKGQPKCRCKAGYSGERCEVNACQGYCLNNGVCSLNEDHAPVCQCVAGYDGERCAVPAVVIKCIQTVSMLRDMLNADIPPVTLSKGVMSACASTVV